MYGICRYSTLEEGDCDNSDTPACHWRLVKAVKKVHSTCMRAGMHAALEKSGKVRSNLAAFGTSSVSCNRLPAPVLVFTAHTPACDIILYGGSISNAGMFRAMPTADEFLIYVLHRVLL